MMQENLVVCVTVEVNSEIFWIEASNIKIPHELSSNWELLRGFAGTSLMYSNVHMHKCILASLFQTGGSNITVPLCKNHHLQQKTLSSLLEMQRLLNRKNSPGSGVCA